jgi:MoaA/NifB/PqqE/SkfB family radical SAM enzyme
MPLPPRLNLAIARRCFVGCPGCYELFGTREPDLEAVLASAGRFAALGVDAVTVSGGDPLTLPDLVPFLRALRTVGVRDVKVDTVGVGLLDARRRAELLAAVDYLGVPLDGWSNESARWFRAGRPHLFDETVALLGALDAEPEAKVIVNSVAHHRNHAGFPRMLEIVERHSSIVQWNVFQYTPTDQATDRANRALTLGDAAFASLGRRLSGTGVNLALRSVRSRLGNYLLVNSDGVAWLPDEHGRTVRLGTLGDDDESTLLARWSAVVTELLHDDVPQLLA